ncbi:MAG: DUF6503 family protein [Aquaticitalea sp.]
MKYLILFAVGLMLFSCVEKKSEFVDADVVINTSINVSGVKKLDNSVLEFDFREKHYKAARSEGSYVLKREFKDSLGSIVDYLSNISFERRVNDSLIYVADSMATKYSAAVNSVHYFAVLPYDLDGKAVNKTYLNDVELKGNNYHKIKVTFDQEGGGEDYEDVFIYWVNTKTSKIDYLAYSYNEADGLGLRFREAYNERSINGVRFVDYNNYKPKDTTIALEDLDRMFLENNLELLSKIELKNVSIN